MIVLFADLFRLSVTSILSLALESMTTVAWFFHLFHLRYFFNLRLFCWVHVLLLSILFFTHLLRSTTSSISIFPCTVICCWLGIVLIFVWVRVRFGNFLKTIRWVVDCYWFNGVFSFFFVWSYWSRPFPIHRLSLILRVLLVFFYIYLGFPLSAFFNTKYNKIEIDYQCRVKRLIKSKLMLFFIDCRSIKISNFRRGYSGKDVYDCWYLRSEQGIN